ncbi:MAG TPA: hypothetical protein VNX46_15540, partial [Candidatus Acidoferrum sp.]|nr:hypothetical protein [Candidatus Acidoferrum sp.]
MKNPRAAHNFQGRTCSIAGVGHYVPEKILTNAELEAMVETTDEWITSRTGIKERRIAAANEFTSDLATKAAERDENGGNHSGSNQFDHRGDPDARHAVPIDSLPRATQDRSL